MENEYVQIGKINSKNNKRNKLFNIRNFIFVSIFTTILIFCFLKININTKTKNKKFNKQKFLFQKMKNLFVN